MSVSSLADAREKKAPHLSGPAKCVDCRHEWQAVILEQAFVDNDQWMECPSCQLIKGRFKYTHLMHDSLVWTCNCGNDLMHLCAPKDGGAYVACCPNCGKEHDFLIAEPDR